MQGEMPLTVRLILLLRSSSIWTFPRALASHQKICEHCYLFQHPFPSDFRIPYATKTDRLIQGTIPICETGRCNTSESYYHVNHTTR